MKRQVTRGSVFNELGFPSAEVANLKIRAVLMLAIEEELEEQKLTQAEASALLNVSQPRISDIKRGKMQLFTIDVLINMLAKLGKPVHVVIDDRMAA
jgi:predicted XRE-type DNA-binding protein